jgi:hypothetical protein
MMLRKLEEIRNSDKATKLRWLVILSAISLALVVGIWIIALQVIVANIDNPLVAQTDSGPSALQSIKKVFSDLGSRTSTAIGNLKNSVGKEEITLKPTTPTE